MSFRFRKRVKVMPGIYLNISKKGVSTTIGPRGASINLGKNGTYLNSSIPGTGISNRTKLFGNDSTTPSLPNDESLPVIEEEPVGDTQNEIVTSEGLKGLKEHFEDCKKERELLLNEISEITKTFSRLQNTLHERKNEFQNMCEKEVELLNVKISDTNRTIVDLEHRLYKKQNGTFSKLFAKPQTIENLQAEIRKSQKQILEELNAERNDSKKPFGSTI